MRPERSHRLSGPANRLAAATAFGLACAAAVSAQGALTLPKSVVAGSAVSIPSTGSGKAVLYIVGPAQVVKQEINLGETATIPEGTLYGAGRYVAVLTGAASESDEFDVVAAKPANLSFLAKPSRLAVSIHDAITGAVYVFDAYHNLVTTPMPVAFELTTPVGAPQSRSVQTHDGAAWTAMDSTGHEGLDKFVASLDGITVTRVIRQVPGDPCGLKMSAKPVGERVALSTDPVKDCSGNAVPDGTIVTFTESYHGAVSTVDVPLKRDIAEAQLPVHQGSTISVASGVVMGNQIGWGK